MSSFYSKDELLELGFKSLGENVLISRYARFYGIEGITIGSNVRIDDFCVLSGEIRIGNYVHIAAFCCLFAGKTGIVLEDFTGVSSRCALYAESDDYLGTAMTNPMVPEKYRKVTGGRIVLKRHALVGSGCTILPDVTVGEGASVGSMSLVRKSLDDWGVYAGIPCKRMKDRSKDFLEFEKELLKDVDL